MLLGCMYSATPFKLVPIVVGDLRPSDHRRYGKKNGVDLPFFSLLLLLRVLSSLSVPSSPSVLCTFSFYAVRSARRRRRSGSRASGHRNVTVEDRFSSSSSVNKRERRNERKRKENEIGRSEVFLERIFLFSFHFGKRGRDFFFFPP